MANEIKKYLDLTALETLVDQIQAEDAKVKAYADAQIAAAGKTYDAAGAAATAESNAKAYTDALANGQVATNNADIAKLNGDATTEGSVAKAIADAKTELNASIEAVDAIADQNTAAIDAINNAESGILAQAKAFATSEDEKVQGNVDELAELVGVIPEGYEATTIAAYAKELADNVAANGYDDTALAAKVDANASAITALQGKDTELAEDIATAQAAAEAAQADIDAFYAAAEVGEAAVDTLKEIQAYITSDGEAAATMTANIQANADAIAALQTADGEQDSKIAALEAKFGEGDGSVEDMIADAKQEAIDAAAADATTKADAALASAKSYTDTEIDAVELRLDALEAVDHEHSNKALLDTYTQTEADLADAVAKKHEHSNLSVLEGITSAKVTAWDAAEQNAKTYADGLNTAMTTKVDGIGEKVTALEEAAADYALDSDLDSAVERIAANETAIAANTSAINSFTAITSAEVEALFA